MAEGAVLVAEWDSSRSRASNMWSPNQLSYTGLCAWNHDDENRARATRIVLTDRRDIKDARAVCEECYLAVLRYVSADRESPDEGGPAS